MVFHLNNTLPVVGMMVLGTVLGRASATPAAHSHDLLLTRSAERACASVRDRVNFRLCVDDVTEAGDLGMATLWVYTDGRRDDDDDDDDFDDDDKEEDLVRDQDNGDLLVRARMACARVPSSSDFDLCVGDVMETRNMGLAELWSKQRRATVATTGQRQQLVPEARVACARVVTGTGFQACVGDVLTTNDLRFADVWSRTEERQSRRLRGGRGNQLLSRLAFFW